MNKSSRKFVSSSSQLSPCLAREKAWLRSLSWLLVSVIMNRNSVSTLNIPSSASCPQQDIIGCFPCPPHRPDDLRGGGLLGEDEEPSPEAAVSVSGQRGQEGGEAAGTPGHLLHHNQY